ncbi:MAG: ferredoxin family protein [Leptospira sp.]|nr:ferredoxin family protein [Leptospira sp.]
MSYVVTEDCLDCKYTSCAAVCPVEAFHEGPEMLYINPDVCIDCNACVSECPVDAIFPDFDLPSKSKAMVQLNEAGSKNFPVIVNSKAALRGPKCIEREKEK